MTSDDAIPEDAEALLRYWFGTDTDDARVCTAQAALWWGGGSETDDEIRARFGELLERARRGDFDDWARSPRGRLALVIMLDQFSRSVHRGTADAFSHDVKAQQLSLDGVAAGDDQQLRPVERTFLYMPLVHAENREVQDRAVDLFARLVQAVPSGHAKAFGAFHRHAIAHRDLILRFGRFPARNEALGRTSTEDEVEFLRQAKSR